jgi:hypothetical protein
MGLLDKLKKEHYTLIELADFSKEEPLGIFVAYQCDNRGLIKKDRTVDMVNLVRMLEYTTRTVEKARGCRSFAVWCGVNEKVGEKKQPVYYDLIKIQNIDFASGKTGFGRSDLRNPTNSGFTFDSNVYGVAVKINYQYI